jgi:dTDP-4-dehydrorhamnose 3,5-epimerase-like enzyme
MNGQVDFNLLKTQVHSRANGKLFSIEHGNPNVFDFKRVFFIKGIAGIKRGEHAHKACAQWISVITGSVSITLKDGSAVDKIALHEFGELLIVPPGIWVEIDFLESSVVAVGADMTYEESDYLRDWSEFMEYKAKI